MIARFSAALSRHGYTLAVVAIALSTTVFLPGRDSFAKGQWALLYLLIILLVASVAGTGPGLLTAVLAFFAWNFFFLPPYHTLRVHDSQDWLALVAFLVVGLLVGLQAGRLREREARALAREQETAALNRLSAAVVTQTSVSHMAESCLKEVAEVLGAGSATLFVLDGDDLESYCQTPAGDCPDPTLAERARQTVRDGEAARGGEVEITPEAVTAAGDGGLYVPVHSPSGGAGGLTRPGPCERAAVFRRRRPSGHLPEQPRGRLSRARHAPSGRLEGRRRARGRPTQGESSVVRVA
jgi:K+-sensing histidine kinase KdpD